MIDKLADELVKGANLDVVMIGPVVWYPASETKYTDANPDDKIWTICVVTQKNGLCITQIYLGIAMSDEIPTWADTCDTVFIIRRSNELDFDEATMQRDKLAQALRSRFSTVDITRSEIEAARYCASRWPSKRTKKLLREVEAEKNAERT